MEYNIFTFPFEQIGWGLRQLSLSGEIGNFFAIIIYLLLGLIPCGVFFGMKRKGVLQRIDFMLFFLSVMLLVVLYYMINPGLLAASIAVGGKGLLGGMFYSLLVGYWVLRMTYGGERNIRVVLIVVMMLFGVSALLELCLNLPAAIQAVQEGNFVSNELFIDAPDLTKTYVFLVLQSIVNIIPNIFGVVGCIFSIKAFDELRKDSYSERAVTMIKKILTYSKMALVIVVVSGILFNLMQLLFAKGLHQMNITVNIPLFTILFILGIHMMASYIEENQRLKQDNDLFI